jgi:hypothetical protein
MRAPSRILAVAGFLALGWGAHEARSQQKPSSDEKTIQGGNLLTPLAEVFDHPEAVIRDQRPHRIDQKRLAFGRTDKMGRFSFDLPDGDYEIRASKSGGFGVRSVLIKMRKSAPDSSNPLIVALPLGE